MELRICHLYPDVLNQSGDAGNVKCLEKRLQWRGIGAIVEKFPIGEKKSLRGFDLVFIGGGQETGQEALMADLRHGRAGDIRAAVEEGIVFLAIDGGMELLGKYREEEKSGRTELVGAIDMHTVQGKERLTGDYVFEVEGVGPVLAFENHAGRLELGGGVEPLGHGPRGGEGVRYKNVFGSYGHGPLLPKNPALCDLILKTALERKYGAVTLRALDDSLEALAREDILRR